MFDFQNQVLLLWQKEAYCKYCFYPLSTDDQRHGSLREALVPSRLRRHGAEAGGRPLLKILFLFFINWIVYAIIIFIISLYQLCFISINIIALCHFGQIQWSFHFENTPYDSVKTVGTANSKPQWSMPWRLAGRIGECVATKTRN